MAARCDCCDLPVEWCGKQAETKQRAQDAAEVAALRSEQGVIEASWTTRCWACHQMIRPGQLIRAHPDRGDGLWVHAWAGDCG